MISFVVATVNRPSLERTLQSIECWIGDEILVVSEHPPVTDNPYVRHVPCAPGNDYGHAERNYVTPFIREPYVCHIDDDDIYAPGAREAMQAAIVTTPNRPVIFRMRAPNGVTLWQDKVIRCGNLGTPTFFLPNMPEKFGTWGSFVGGDCHFLETSKWTPEEYVWRPEVICLVGHNWG